MNKPYKVRISFDRPRDLVIDLTEEQYAAAQDEYSWEDFYSLMEDHLMEHLYAETAIDDIRDE